VPWELAGAETCAPANEASANEIDKTTNSQQHFFIEPFFAKAFFIEPPKVTGICRSPRSAPGEG
jgi:hypothetical protein